MRNELACQRKPKALAAEMRRHHHLRDRGDIRPARATTGIKFHGQGN
jgi:hypothetical protein